MSIRFLVLFLFFLKPAMSEEFTIAWRDNYGLTWADFKGKIEPDIDAVAVTTSGIIFSFSVNQSNAQFVGFSAEAEAYLYPEKSWYFKSKSEDHILAHEQLHFDITELHVSQLRYNASKIKVSKNIKQNLRDAHEETNRSLAAIQNDYDTQTDNSIHKKHQVIWS